MLCKLSEHFQSEVPGLERPSQVPEIQKFDVYAGDVGSEGNWDLPDLTGGLDTRRIASTSVDYDQLREV